MKRELTVLASLGALAIAACVGEPNDLGDAEPVGTTVLALAAPNGFVDGIGRHSINGWACIADYNAPLWIHFYDGTTYIGSTQGNSVNRPDVAWICGGNTLRGFEWALPRMGGAHTIETYVSTSSAPSRVNRLPGASSITWPYPLSGDHPFGYVETLTPTTISGWACDRNTPGVSIDIHAYIQYDGVGPFRFLEGTATTGFRGDLVSICGSGANTAFTIQVPPNTRKGLNNIVVYGINRGPGLNNSLNESGNVPNLVDFGCVPPGLTGFDDTDDLQAVLNTGQDLVLCPSFYNLVSNACGKWALCYTRDGQSIITKGLPNAEAGFSSATLAANGSSVLGVLLGEYTDLRLRGVRIDGMRPAYGVTQSQRNQNIAMVEFGKLGRVNTGHLVEHNLFRSPRGWSALHVSMCDRAEVGFNKFADMGCSRWGSGCAAGDPWASWADGISLDCTNSRIYGNSIDNATDGAIVLFAAAGTEVFNNMIRAIDRELLGGINLVDTGNPVLIGGLQYSNYQGVRVHDNTIIAQGKAIDVGIAQGNPAWFCPGTPSALTGAVVTNNSFQGPHFRWAAVLDNVHNWTFTGNSFTGTFSGPATTSPCSGGGTIPSPSRICAKNHIFGASNIQSNCGGIFAGETLHEVLLDN